MKEENIDSLLQQDNALREALKMEETELPQMPSDLNSRVLEKVARQSRKTLLRRMWPWLAAACVVAFIVVNVMPPKNDCLPADNLPKVSEVAKPATPKAEVQTAMELNESNQKPVVAEVKKPQPRKVIAKQQKADKITETQITDTVVPEVLVEEEPTVEIAQTVKPNKDDKPIVITERDIPITRSENYIYTPEEIELMKRQANEAYLKWVELELEITRYNLEQTAQK